MSPSPLLCLAILLAVPLLSADVLSWRNGGKGLYPESTVPLNWDEPAALWWKRETPIKANACPILVGNKLIYTMEPAGVVCADARTGETIWTAFNAYEDIIKLSPAEQKELARAKAAMVGMADKLKPLQRDQYKLQRRLRNDRQNAELKGQLREVRKQLAKLNATAGNILERFEKPKTHNINGYASYTPCSDGESVYVCNGLGVVAKFNLEGTRIWAKKMEQPDHGWGGAVSPTLVDGKLIVRFSDYTALDPETGEELWRVPNPKMFGVPASFELEGQWFLYTCRGELIRVADGKKLPSQDWTIKTMSFAFFNTPYLEGNRLYVVHGAQGIQDDAYCMEIPKTVVELERRGLQQVWYKELFRDRYYANPLVIDGLMYTFSMQHHFQVLEAADGGVVYDHIIKGMTGRTFPGLLHVQGKIYAGEEDGTILFLEPGRKYQEHKRFRLEECRSTPIFAGDTAYLRTLESLWAFKVK